MTQQQLIQTPAAQNEVTHHVDGLVACCHGLASEAGWWTCLETGADIRSTANVPEKLMLIVSEVAEAMEGYRKNLRDDKLVHRSMFEVELADILIRVADLAGALNLDLGGAVAEKLAFNSTRHDHTMEHRAGENGKKF